MRYCRTCNVQEGSLYTAIKEKSEEKISQQPIGSVKIVKNSLKRQKSTKQEESSSESKRPKLACFRCKVLWLYLISIVYSGVHIGST